MKQQQWKFLTALMASVSLLAACQMANPTQTKRGDQTLVNGSKAGAVDTSLQQQGDATVFGKVTDTAGKPVGGATVFSGASKTTTDGSGAFTLKVNAGRFVNVKVTKPGYIIRDGVVAALANERVNVAIALKPKDEKLTRISAAEGGKAVSSDGQVQLIFEPGALSANADVRVTWLDPTGDAKRPAAFKVMQTASASDTMQVSGDVTASQTILNDTDLPGPLETYAYDETRKFFSPVSFAGVELSAPLEEGDKAKLRMRVSDEVLKEMLESGDLKIPDDLNKEIYPCFFWNDEAMDPAIAAGLPVGWDKPALSKVVKDDGVYWFEYTLRDTNMQTASSYRTFASDEVTQTKVELIVGGGRRVVDAAGVIGALIERSSDEQYDLKGIQTVLKGAPDQGNYFSSAYPNLVRPDVPTQGYTGTNLATVFTAETTTYKKKKGKGGYRVLDITLDTTETETLTAAEVFEKWDRNGQFTLIVPTGAPYTIIPPTYMGVTPPTVTGTASLPDPDCTTTTDALGNVTTSCTVKPAYVNPIYYYTDAKVNVTLTGPEVTAGQDFWVEYTVAGVKYKEKYTAPLNITVPRNETGTGQPFTLDLVYNDLLTSDEGPLFSGSLLPGAQYNTTVKVMYSAVGK